MPDQEPRSVGAYQLIDFIGQGGMGAVYSARHRNESVAARQGGLVAVKVMHLEHCRDRTFRDRFEREAEVGLSLEHPGIVKVHDFVVDGSTLAIVMELLRGLTLAGMIGERTGPIPWERAWPIFAQLLDAVEYAHTRRVVHRDLKPANVMVTTEGRVKILDFGIAKRTDSHLTGTGSRFGTVEYMAPEQYLDAKKVDHRADIYALGMTLYEMLAGRLPWATTTSEFQVQTIKARGDLPPPTAFYPHIPPQVVAAVLHAIALDPAARFPDIAAFREAVQPPKPAPPPPEPAPPPAPPPDRREDFQALPGASKGIWASASLSLLALVVGCVALLLGLILLVVVLVHRTLRDEIDSLGTRIEGLDTRLGTLQSDLVTVRDRDVVAYVRYRIPVGKTAARVCHENGKRCLFVPTMEGWIDGKQYSFDVWDCTAYVEKGSGCESGSRIRRGRAVSASGVSILGTNSAFCAPKDGWEWVYCLDE